MDIKLFDSELKVMGVLWDEGDTTAKHISDVLKEEIGWNMNTTYTLIKRCIKKGAIERSEPNFMCHAIRRRYRRPRQLNLSIRSTTDLPTNYLLLFSAERSFPLRRSQS